MACLKCGRETGENDVFCQDCLLTMQRYPVRPGTAVVIPKRKPAPAPKKVVKKKGPTPEEQVKALKTRVLLLSLALFLSLVIVAILAKPAWQTYRRQHLRPGQNYSVTATTAETTQETTEAAATAATEAVAETTAP